MLNLLHDCTRSGYPPEYLLSRIRGRMAAHISEEHCVSKEDTTTFQVDDAVIWDEVSEERRWIYLQMDNALRQALAPLLFYFEINTIVLCLRNLEARQSGVMAVNCEKGLLSEELKEIVLAMDIPASIVLKLERFMGHAGFVMDGLATAYEGGGVQKCEELFRQRFLEQVPVVCSHPEVVNFFRMIIDLKNTLTMSKCLRWKKQEVPMLINGGRIKLRKGDIVPTEYGLKKMIRHFAGGSEAMGGDLHPVELEPLLYAHLSRIMKRRMGSGDPVVCCIGYVWHCFTFTRKWSCDYHAGRFAKQITGNSGIMQ